MPLHHPMLDSGFVDTLLRHFGDGSEHLCVLGSPSDPDALCILRRRAIGDWHSFLPSQTQVGPQLVPGSACLRTLFESLPGRVERIDLLSIDPAVLPKGGEPTHQRMLSALTVNVSLAGTFDDYWANRSKNLRHNMRRYARRTAEVADKVEHIRITSPADIARAVSRYAQLESAGWKGREGTALAPGNAQEAFYTDLLLRLSELGRAFVYEMWIGNRLAASRLVISSDHAVAILKTTYDETLNAYAPGRQQLHALIADCFSRHPGKTLEFCTNASVEQIAWATDCRHIEHWTLLRGVVSSAIFQTTRVTRNLFQSNQGTGGKDTVQVEIHKRLADLPHCAIELLNEHSRRDMQFGGAWLENLERTVYRNHPGIRYFVLRSEDTALVVLPLLVEPGRHGNDAFALGNFYTASYCPAMRPWLRPEALAPLVDAVVRNLAPLRAIRLAPMDPDSTEFKLLMMAFEQRGLATFPFFCFANWSLHSHGKWTEYLAGRDGQLRSTIRRMTKRLQQEGGRVEVLTETSDLQRGLAAYALVYASSWKVPEPYPEFVPSLAALCAERGWLRLGLIWLGDRPIAAQLWIVTDRRASIFKLAYDEAFRSHSPGTVLTATLMQHVLEHDQVEIVDYLTGDDAYKKQWMNQRRERWGLVAYNLRSVAGLFGCALESLGRAVKGWRGRRTSTPEDTASRVGGRT